LDELKKAEMAKALLLDNLPITTSDKVSSFLHGARALGDVLEAKCAIGWRFRREDWLSFFQMSLLNKCCEVKRLQ